VWPAADIGGALAARQPPLHEKAVTERRPAPGRSVPEGNQQLAGTSMATASPAAPMTPELDLPQEALEFIILKAREYDVKEGDSDPGEGSNPIDDGQADVLEDSHGDPVREELLGAIGGLNEEDRMKLVALAWLGRGTYELSEWKEALATARREHGRRPAEYLIALPLLGDYLEDGMALFDRGIVDDSDRREGVDDENEPLGNRTIRRDTDSAGG
jgi:hypothetical protein